MPSRTVNVKLENDRPKKWDHGIQPIVILFCVLAENIFICEHYDPSVDVERRYYREVGIFSIERIYGLNDEVMHPISDEVLYPIADRLCIGGSPGKNLDQCKFNGYLKYDELCNPCEVKEFKEQCEELCEITTGPLFGRFVLK